MHRRYWPAALALLSVLLLGSHLLYTEQVMREIRSEAAIHTRMYALVQQGLLSLEPEAELRALLALQNMVLELGVPMIAVNAEGELQSFRNLPFPVDPSDPADRARVLAYTAVLDQQNPPIVEPGVGTMHFGAPPILKWLRWVPWLQVAGVILLATVGFAVVRANFRAERERMWAGMARELAHQMGTPLSSLAGWVEVLSLPTEERRALAGADHIAREIRSDLERLERVSRRFELIGKPPALEPVAAAEIVDELEGYLRPRLPRLAAGVDLRMRVRRGLAPVLANRVLLVWALENVVKNSLDALAGRGGRIRVAVVPGGRSRIRFAVTDNGPGISPALRERLFEPGVSTKSGGWGVGLSLARRIIEDVHGGRISARAKPGGGASFEIELPAATERGSRRRVRKRA